MVITGNLIDKQLFGPIELFISYSNALVTFFILGLDQSLVRFYNEPPNPLTKNSLFRVCVYISLFVFIILSLLIYIFFYDTLYNFIGFGGVIINGKSIPHSIITLLLLNSFSLLILRYFTIIYRMEMNIKGYAIIVILQQIITRLFFLLGIFCSNPIMGMSIASVIGFAVLASTIIIMRFNLIKPHNDKTSKYSQTQILKYGLAVAPTIIFITLNSQLPKSFILMELGQEYQSTYSFLLNLSNIVTLIQGGFAAFWGAYVFKYYRSEQNLIMKTHDYLNLLVLTFFAMLVLFQDIIFLFFKTYNTTLSKTIFPLMMLGAVFNILCEGTVYGNAIANKPIFDTIGIAIALLANIIGCRLLIPLFSKDMGLLGGAIALALSCLLMFFIRTFTAQKYYRSIRNYKKTFLAILITLCYTIGATIFINIFFIKITISLGFFLAILLLYINEVQELLLYRKNKKQIKF